MQRLNSLEIPKFDLSGLVGSLTGVSGGMPGFAAGGALAPAAAGEVRSGFTLVLDGNSFSVATDQRTLQSLMRIAKGEAVRTTGKRPDWST